MHAQLMRIVLALALAALAAASGPTKLYIDSVPEYDLLASCAEHQVSLVVRSMAYGCGDGSQTTSYACFCYRSSAYYSRMISTKVTSACSKSGGPESSALEVFSKYCQLGDIEKATTTDSSFPEGTGTVASVPTTKASPASNPTVATNSPTAATSSPTANPAPQTTSSPKKKKKKNTSAIAAGITVPVVVIALGLAGLFVYLRYRKRTTSRDTGDQTGETSGASLVGNKDSQRDAYEKDDNDVRHEMDVSNQRAELPGSTSEQDRNGKIERLVANSGRP